MKKLFRHISTWLLFLGIVVSFFAFTNATHIYQKVQLALYEVNEYKYKYEYSISISDIPKNTDVLDRLKKIPGNIICTGNYVYLDKEQIYQECDVIIKQEEKLPYPVKISDPDGEVYVGKKFLDLCYNEGEKKYLTINGEKLQLAGVLSSDKTDTLNYKIILVNESDKVKHIIDSSSVLIKCGSNQSDYYSEISDFYDEFCDDMYVDFYNSSGKYIDIGSKNAYEYYYLTISLFSIINSIVISEFWILRRKKEIIIRRLWGYSDLKLFKLLFGQIVCVASLAVIFVVILQSGLFYLGFDYETISFRNIKIALVFVLVSSLAISLLPIYKVSKYKLNQGKEMI